MKISEALKKVESLKNEMWNKLKEVNIEVDFNNYEKVHDKYLDSFGKDYIIKMYEEINQALSDCPIMVD